MLSELLAQSADAIGISGVVLLVLAYFLLNTNRISVRGLYYQLLNFTGAALILFSLFYHWNTASVLIEVVWMFISLIGIYRIFFVYK